jgi:hypothetical protein
MISVDEAIEKVLSYGSAKLLIRPYESKAICKECPINCYALGYRERIWEAMRSYWPYMINKSRLDLFP